MLVFDGPFSHSPITAVLYYRTGTSHKCILYRIDFVTCPSELTGMQHVAARVRSKANPRSGVNWRVSQKQSFARMAGMRVIAAKTMARTDSIWRDSGSRPKN